MIGYKGFDKNFQCRGFQFKVGETYKHDGELIICESGFHFCDTPLAVLAFYPPVDGNRFALVEAIGTIVSCDDEGHKSCTNELKILKELSLNDLVQEVPDAVTHTGDYSAATNTGDYSAATNTGYRSAAIVTGENSIAIVTGIKGRAKGVLGSWLVLTEWANSEISSVKAFKVDGVSILPDTFYTLEDGKPVIADGD